MSRASIDDNGNGTYIPSLKKKIVPPTKPKGIVIGASAASAPFISNEEEEEEPILGGDDIIPPNTDVPMEGLNEEEQLAIALKAYVDTTLEEQVAPAESFIYGRAPGNRPFLSLFLFPFILIRHGHPNMCIPAMFVGGLLPR